MNGIPASATVIATGHIRQQMQAKGITGEAVRDAVRNPYKITDVRRYPGQKRYCGGGVAVIVKPEGHNRFTLITVYLDGVVTPLRDDQKNDPAALNSRRLNRG